MSRPNTLSTLIEEELAAVLTRIAKERCMYKVHEELRAVNNEAYKPTLLAIGPYHHGNVGQGFMKEHKLLYLQQMLERTEGISIETYITILRKLEKEARKYYAAECISQIPPDEFVKMMLLDGCFIIELFRKHEIYRKTKDHKDDPIFQMKWVLPIIARDLLLFENQLPLFVLVELFRVSKGNEPLLPTESRNSGELIINILEKHGIRDESSTSTAQIIPTPLNDLALEFFSKYLPFRWNVNNSTKRIMDPVGLRTHKAINPSLQVMICKRSKLERRFKNPDCFEHLLSLIHAAICISILDTEIDHAKERQEAGDKFKMDKIFKPLFGPICKAITSLRAKEDSMEEPLLGASLTTEPLNGAGLSKERRVGASFHRNIHGATELKEAGIKFKAAEEGNAFSIKFNMNGLLEISPLSIEDHTETYLRNLIAYEQYCDQHIGLISFVTYYVIFMDDLINSPKDVELLRRNGIIRNCLGGDEVISTMVNKLCHNITISTKKSIYAAISKELNMHCSNDRNIWMAKLRHDYFNTPWALVSFLAAALLLALTIIQTIFSVIP